MPPFNPFPGLRPFEPDEDHLFFGREKEIDELLRRLRATRFLQVVGASGSGKSSLVRSGLIPALHSGFMSRAGTDWRVLIFRPGADPIGNLAASLNAPDVLGTEGEFASTNKVLLEATLRRSARGLVDAVRQARIPPDDNVLVVVDQFEELFRFRRSQTENSRDEAVAFFKLLLEAAQQTDIPVYITLTMRADFIGDCMEFPGLPQSVNRGLYLVPRMTRDELRSAITGPIAVAEGDITQRLVLRLLNDVSDDQDQLPVLQHALMRTWDHWASRERDGESIDIPDYEAVGALHGAMSLHADEAYQEVGSEQHRRIAEKMFKALTDTFSDPRGVRRPTSVSELAAICEVPDADVIQVLDVFRRAGRSFLTPLPGVALHSQSVIDLSHESLMRCWTRLMAWADEEKESALSYIRVSQAASWCAECTGGLWTDPQLETGLQWRRENRPTAAWAARYDSNFADAMEFLDRSEEARTLGRKKERRRKQIRQATIYVLGSLLAMVGGLLYLVRLQARRAENNLRRAKATVDQSLASARNEAGFAGESEYTPQMEEFRKELLGEAGSFYSTFTREMPRNEYSRNEAAVAYSRLGDIHRLLQNYAESAKEYRAAISQFEQLSRQHPSNLEYQRNLGNAHNGLAETLRLALQVRAPGSEPKWSDAESEYAAALAVQQPLLQAHPSSRDYSQELARTYYNRGILQYNGRLLDEAEADFRQAVRLLEPLNAETIVVSPADADQGLNPDPREELARASSDLGVVLRKKGRSAEAEEMYRRAIELLERLVKIDPDKRLYKLELAQFLDNMARLLLEDEHRPDLAESYNHRAVDLIEDLASPSRSLEMERIGAHLVRGRIVESTNPRDVRKEIEQSFEILQRHRDPKEHSEFHAMYVHVAFDYLLLGQRSLESGSLEEARQALDRVVLLLPELTNAERQDVKPHLHALQKELQDKQRKKKENRPTFSQGGRMKQVRLVPALIALFLLPFPNSAQQPDRSNDQRQAGWTVQASEPPNTADDLRSRFDLARYTYSGLVFGQEAKAAPQKPKPDKGKPHEIKRPPIEDSMVGYVDNAIIGSQVRVRFDAAFDDNSPDRAEFFYAKCGCYRALNGTPFAAAYDPNAPGPGTGIPTAINYQQLRFNVEYAPARRWSLFVDVPIRWLQPQGFVPASRLPFTPSNFGNQAGISDVEAGFKAAAIASPNTFLTFQFRAYFPSGDSFKGLGTAHYSIEPGILLYQKLSDRMALEAQVSDWHPIGGSAGVPVTNSEGFAGDVFTYGIGPSYRLYRRESLSITPVVEMVGWRVLSGFQSLQPGFKEVSGTNIVNIKAGFRTSIGGHSSFYIGFGQAATHDLWYKHLLRLEYRYTF